MRILAIDTATEACSVAVLNNKKVYSNFEKCICKHTQRILPLIKNILNKSAITLTELDALAFSRGPGSFTGIRIGLGITQGLALGAKLPVIGISTLATMAQSAWRITGAKKILTAIDARMGEVYWAEYTKDENNIWYGEETETILKPEKVHERLQNLSGEWITVGTGWKTWPKMADGCDIFVQKSNILFPTAEDMLQIAAQLLKDGKIVSVEKAEPVYLRQEVAKKSF